MPRNRTHRYAFYLNDEENEMLLSLKSRFHMSISELIRLLIMYQHIKFPPKDIHSVVAEFRRTGNNLNQIARALNSKALVNPKEITNAIAELRACEKQLLEKFEIRRT